MDTIWTLIENKFNRFPAQAKVARALLSMGLCVSNRKIYCGDVEMSVSGLARSLKVDRRIITNTVHTIMKDRKLKDIYSRLEPVCGLHKAAPVLKWAVLEVHIENKSGPGTFSKITGEVGKSGVEIRQVYGMDPVEGDGRFFIITDGEIPASTVMKIKKINGVKRVIL
jgi:predicted regulator of amino acid metabolism with ACT domain